MHGKQLEKSGTGIKIDNSGYNLAVFDVFKSEILSELKRVKYRDLENIVYRLQLTYNEIIDLLNVKYMPGSTIGYTLPPGVYEISDINSMLMSLFPGKVKVNIRMDDIRVNSNLNNNETIRLTKKPFFHSFSIYGTTLRSIR